MIMDSDPNSAHVDLTLRLWPASPSELRVTKKRKLEIHESNLQMMDFDPISADGVDLTLRLWPATPSQFPVITKKPKLKPPPPPPIHEFNQMMDFALGIRKVVKMQPIIDDFEPFSKKIFVQKGYNLGLMMSKKLTKSDMSPQQHRLLIPTRFVSGNIVPNLLDGEKAAASLTAKSNNKNNDNGETSTSKKKGRVHEGLEVIVHSPNRPLGCPLSLARWDGSTATVLKGNHYMNVLNGFEAGDKIEMWAFRDGERGPLHFVIAMKEEEEDELDLTLHL